MFGLKNNFLFKFSKDRNLKVFRRKDHSEIASWPFTDPLKSLRFHFI